MGASGPPNTRTSATACVYGLQLRGSLFGQVHIPTGVDRWNLGTSPPAGLRTLTVVAQEQKAVLAKLFNHSEKQTNAQVGHLAMPWSDSLSLDFGHFSGADPRSARVPLDPLFGERSSPLKIGDGGLPNNLADVRPGILEQIAELLGREAGIADDPSPSCTHPQGRASE